MFAPNQVAFRVLVFVTMGSLAFIMGSLPGCVGEDDSCDSDQVVVDVQCVPREPDGGDGDGGNDPDGSNGGDVDLPAGMGDACEEDADCTLEATYCAFNPMAGAGYCTLSDCTVDPNDCPAPYKCKDMSIMSPDLPTVCLSEADCAALGC